MLKIFFKFIKNLIVSCLFLYAFDVMVQPVGIFIPINIITVLLLMFLGFPAMVGLILFYFILLFSGGGIFC